MADNKDNKQTQQQKTEHQQQKVEVKKPEFHKEKDLRYLVRILNTDMDGSKKVGHELTKIKGVGYQYANMACRVSGTDANKKAGDLKPEDIEKIEDILKNPLKYNVPSWLFNRRKDPEGGANKHILTVDLTFIKDNDIKQMKKMRTYKGVRHMYGLPVRGQKTRSKFRKNKGKVMGVKRSAGVKSGGKT